MTDLPDVEEVTCTELSCVICQLEPDILAWHCNKCGLVWHCTEWLPCTICDDPNKEAREAKINEDYFFSQFLKEE